MVNLDSRPCYLTNTNMRKISDQQKVLRVLIKGNRWFHSYELIGDYDGTFLSHRGPARISELSTKHSEMIETDRTEKTYKYRFRSENISEMLLMLPVHLAEFVKQELVASQIPFQNSML